MQANASRDSVKPRFAVEAHLATLFATADLEATEGTEQATSQGESAPNDAVQSEETQAPMQLPVALSQEMREDLTQTNKERHDWTLQLGAQDRNVTGRCYQRVADFQMSTTDPDATIMLSKDGAHLGYQTHYVVDGGKNRIILNVLVTPAEVMENQSMRDLVWRTCFRFCWMSTEVLIWSIMGVSREALLSGSSAEKCLFQQAETFSVVLLRLVSSITPPHTLE